MSEDNFRKQVEKGLKKLDRQQRRLFAWRCAVRALPFLASQGSFDFWGEKKRQSYFYSIFYALDYVATTTA